MLLERTAKNNLLVKVCLLYLESDFVMAGLKALWNFTYPIIAFLNFVERVDQNTVCSIIQLYSKSYKISALQIMGSQWSINLLEIILNDLELVFMEFKHLRNAQNKFVFFSSVHFLLVV